MDCVNSSVVVAMVILNISEVLQGEVTPIRPVENVRKKGEGKKKKTPKFEACKAFLYVCNMLEEFYQTSSVLRQVTATLEYIT